MHRNSCGVHKIAKYVHIQFDIQAVCALALVYLTGNIVMSSSGTHSSAIPCERIAERLQKKFLNSLLTS